MAAVRRVAARAGALGRSRALSGGVHFGGSDADVEQVIEQSLVGGWGVGGGGGGGVQGSEGRAHPADRRPPLLRLTSLASARAPPPTPLLPPPPPQDQTTYRRREDVTRVQVLTTRREALALYREILRVTALFVWQDEHGRPWCARCAAPPPPATPAAAAGAAAAAAAAAAAQGPHPLSSLPWCARRRDVLRHSARREFEAARYEADPEIVSPRPVAGQP